MRISLTIQTILLFLVFQTSVFGQEDPQYKVENIRLQIHDNDLKVGFDLIGINTQRPTHLTLLFYDKDFRIYYPKTCTPNLKNEIEPDNDLHIMWHLSTDLKKIDKPLTPLLIAGNPQQHKFGAGTEAALLSVLVPGLGDYFVNNTRNQTVKPYLRTLSALGFIAWGTYTYRERYRGEPKYTDSGDIWSAGEWHYKYFRNDAELFIGIGAAIWAADIIWVAIKGNNNKTLKKSIRNLNINIY